MYVGDLKDIMGLKRNAPWFMYMFYIHAYSLTNLFRYTYESSQDCCKWAYKDAEEGSTLEGNKYRAVIPQKKKSIELCYIFFGLTNCVI